MDIVILVLILILTAILCLPIFQSYKRKKAISKYIDQLPGDKKYPVIGTTLNAFTGRRETYWELMKDRHSKYGPIFRSWLGSIPLVHIYKPEHAQILLKSNTNINKGSFYKFLTPWLGGGLISGNLPHWRHHRKVITPAFHFKVLESYNDTFSEKAEDFLQFLDKYSGQGYFEITQHITQFSVDVISETAMGVKLNFLKNSESKYAAALADYFATAINRVYNPIIHNNFLFSLTQIGRDNKNSLDYIKEFNKKVINQRRENFTKSKSPAVQEDEFGRKKKMSFLDILLTQEENSNFSYEEIEEEVNTFMFAGQDTSATAICFSLLALGNNPDIMKKLQFELDTIFESDPDRKITPRDIAEMNYLDMIVKEVLRCYTVVPFVARELLEDVEIDGVHIPKGVGLTVSLYNLHHDSDHYPDPWKFDPDRFLPENVEKRHPFAYVPFSAGPRNCIGQRFALQNIKTLLAYIFRKHDVTCQEKPEDIKYYYEVVLRPQNGLHIAIQPRQRQ